MLYQLAKLYEGGKRGAGVTHLDDGLQCFTNSLSYIQGVRGVRVLLI